MLGKASLMVILSHQNLLTGADNRPPLERSKLAKTPRLYFCFFNATLNQTKLHHLVVLRKANLVAILSHPDLLAGTENGTPLEWPKIGQNTKAIA